MKSFISILFPQLCLGCRKAGSVLCDECSTKIAVITRHFCIVCGTPCIRGFTHLSCLSAHSPERLEAPFQYEGLVRSAVHKSKFNRKYFSVLEDLLNQAFILEMLSDFEVGPEAIAVPVPLSTEKLALRGFNQSEKIAEVLCKTLKIRLEPGAVSRIANTKSQSGLSRSQRTENLKSAFDCSRTKVFGRDILLVDDIITTGSTFLAISKVLKSKGARFIWCFALARTPLLYSDRL